jgi:hypothetical protein
MSDLTDDKMLETLEILVATKDAEALIAKAKQHKRKILMNTSYGANEIKYRNKGE